MKQCFLVIERATHFSTELPLSCWIATVLVGLFGECHSSSAALDQQCPDVTKQPLVRDWLATPNADDFILSSLKIQREICAGVSRHIHILKKNLARLFPAKSLHLSAVNVYRRGVKELSGPTKGATEAACRPVPEGCNNGKVRLLLLAGMIRIVIRITFLRYCTAVWLKRLPEVHTSNY